MKKITLKAVKEKLAENKSLESFLRKKRVYTKYVLYAYISALKYEDLDGITRMSSAFSWDDSEEGWDFWDALDDEYDE